MKTKQVCALSLLNNLYLFFIKQKEATIAKTFRRGGRGPIKREEDPHRINRRIKAKEVRLVGENIEVGIYSLNDALKIAEEQGLDLVEISAKADPPVCKIIDYSKFKYEQKKKQKELKTNAHKVIVKEIRFGPNTDDHDLEFKTRHAQKFLEDGNKVKAYVQFAGRNIVFKERGREILDRFGEGLVEFGKAEEPPKMEGRRMIVMYAPKSGTSKPKKSTKEDKPQDKKSSSKSRKEEEE